MAIAATGPHREEDQLGGRPFGLSPHGGYGKGLFESTLVDVVQTPDTHPDLGHRTLPGSPFDGIDNRAAQPQLVHSILLDRDDLDPHVHLRLDPEHEDPGWLHPKVPDIETGFPR
jgi:hypothetical protein